MIVTSLMFCAHIVGKPVTAPKPIAALAPASRALQKEPPRRPLSVSGSIVVVGHAKPPLFCYQRDPAARKGAAAFRRTCCETDGSFDQKSVCKAHADRVAKQRRTKQA